MRRETQYGGSEAAFMPDEINKAEPVEACQTNRLVEDANACL